MNKKISSEGQLKQTEIMKQEELKRKTREAEERMRKPPQVWHPREGEKKAIEVLRKPEKDSEYESTQFFVLKDLQDGQIYSLLGDAVLEKHLQIGKQYLLLYKGKVKNDDRSYHRWMWEELR